MEKDLIKFYDNINKINKDICNYEDEKGNYFLVPTSQLLVGCEYKELTKQEYEQAVFQMIVDKKVELNEIKTTKLVDKYSKTKIEADKGTLIDATVMAKQCWIVKNQLGLTKTFNNKEEAVALTKELNDKIFKIAEINQ